MSWSLSVASVPREEVRAALERARDSQLDASEFDEWADGVDEQMAAAFDAVERLADAVNQERVNAAVSGHSAQAEGEADSIGATVYGIPG